MSRWRNVFTKAGAAVMAGMLLLVNPLTVKAWTLEGDSSIENDIETKNPSSLITTIQTDFHAGNTTGFVVLTPSPTVDSILGITPEMQQAEGRGIIFLANSQCGDAAKDIFKAEAGKLGGEVLWYYDMLLFKNDGTWNEQRLTIDSPLKMAIGISKENRGNYNYAMITYNDGVTKVCPDLDSDDYTLTFEADTFFLAAMIRYPKDTDINQTAQTQNQTVPQSQTETTADEKSADPTIASELDDVPKTGESLALPAEALLLSGVGFLLLAGAFGLKRNI